MARQARRSALIRIVLAALVVVRPGIAYADDVTNPAIFSYPSRSHPVVDDLGMVVAQERIAARIGAEILAEGGNAVDAAAAVGFALAVTLPRAGNIGGGGFMLIYLADEGRTVAVDYREMAPAAATRDMFLDDDGNADPVASRFTRLAAGVPGTVRGLNHVVEHYGTMPLRRLVEPAARLAADGVVLSADFAGSLVRARSRFERDPESLRVFFKPDGSAYEPGEVLRQPDLAWSLGEIAKRGPDAFYKGRIASRIVDDMQRNGGLITRADLAAYEVIEREPVTGTFRGYEIVSMPPPSSGGVHVIQMLNTLEQFPLAEWGHGSARTIHVMTEAMRTAYADRSKHLGDPDFVDVPVDWLTSAEYARQTATAIPMDSARTSAEVAPGAEPRYESPDTTHYSVADGDGNLVANTYTINFSYGSGITVPGTGMLLNNEMDDFSAKPGTPNAFGLLGGEANAVEPAKRPLSSMTPTLVLKDGKPLLATGSPGGSLIINTVLHQIINLIEFSMNASDAVAAPRFHHQWLPDVLVVERGFSPDTLVELGQMGHSISPARFTMGSLQSIVIEGGQYHGAADPRRPDALAIGPGAIRCRHQKAACGN